MENFANHGMLFITNKEDITRVYEEPQTLCIAGTDTCIQFTDGRYKRLFFR